MLNWNAPPKGMPFSSACMASSSMRRNPGEALGGVCMDTVPVLSVSFYCAKLGPLTSELIIVGARCSQLVCQKLVLSW